jgi:dTMP kinase
MAVLMISGRQRTCYLNHTLIGIMKCIAQIRELDLSKGRLISFEGLDGAGKTTQIELMEQWLQAQDISYVRTREPGGTPLGVEIRQLLLNRPELAIVPLTEAYLFQADRAQHFEKVILPALEAGKVVITDRYIDASTAYQGFGRGVDQKFIEKLSRRATQGRDPDLTILLDLNHSQVPMRIGMQMALPGLSDAAVGECDSTDTVHTQNDIRLEQNRLDKENRSFHRRVQEGFRKLADRYPERIKVVDASMSIEKIHEEIIRLVQTLLEL